MKRVFGITSAAVIGLLLSNSSFVFAQGNAQSSTGGTRIATVNMYLIMKGYKKVEVYKNEMRTMAKPFDKEIKEFQKNYDYWTKKAQNGGDPKNKVSKDDAAKYAVYYKRKIEDKQMEARKLLAKRGQEQIVQLYREIEEAVQRTARSNGIHVVFHYLEPLDDKRYTAANIDRKLNGCGNAGACAPIYIAPHIDISEQVLQNLNAQYSASGAGVVPTGG